MYSILFRKNLSTVFICVEFQPFKTAFQRHCVSVNEVHCNVSDNSDIARQLFSDTQLTMKFNCKNQNFCYTRIIKGDAGSNFFQFRKNRFRIECKTIFLASYTKNRTSSRVSGNFTFAKLGAIMLCKFFSQSVASTNYEHDETRGRSRWRLGLHVGAKT